MVSRVPAVGTVPSIRRRLAALPYEFLLILALLLMAALKPLTGARHR